MGHSWSIEAADKPDAGPAAVEAEFGPLAAASRVVAAVAGDPLNRHRAAAAAALEGWRNALATPAQIAAVTTGNGLKVESRGVLASPGHGGAFVQVWVWVPNAD